MKTDLTIEQSAGGMDQRFIAEANSATSILNMRVDDEGLGWVRDRGWEPYNPPAGFSRFLAVDAQPIYSLAVHSRNRGAEVYAIYEQAGQLLYEHGIAVSSFTAEKQYLDAGRTIPLPDDPGTQYVEHGRDLYIVNGSDAGLRFRGDKRVRGFGFTRDPGPPDVFGPDPDYYDSGSYPRNAAGTVALRMSRPRGLGSRDMASDGTQARYMYRIAWESETGSISPLSAPSTVVWQFSDNSEQGAYAVLLRNLDQGDAGVVAIRIYRTKDLVNIGTQGEATYWFLDRIRVGSEDYVDVTPDSQLVDPAPSLTDSITIPATLRYLESWDGRLWAAGGPGHEHRLMYSSASGPEQFGAFDFFDVGMRKGGAITALQSYLGCLLVFRERAIEVITPSMSTPGYRLSVLSPDVGTVATNTTTYVPGVGVLFLGYDGVRTITGQDTSLQLVRNSMKVSKDLRRMNRSAMARATAAWSPKEREWWCHYPADGSVTPNRGIVYHRDTDAWSVRAAVAGSSPGAFQFNALAALPSGYFIFGCQTVNTSVIVNNPVLWNAGLQVWSASGREGLAWNGALVDGSIYSLSSTTLGNRVTGVWTSRWENFGTDVLLKSIRQVFVEGVTVGHNALQLDYAVDWTEKFTSAGSQSAAISSIYGGASEAAVYGAASTNDNGAVVGTSAWTQEKVSRIRWDVATKAIGWFCWRITATDRFWVLRYRIGYVSKQRRVLKQGAR